MQCRIYEEQISNDNVVMILHYIYLALNVIVFFNKLKKNPHKKYKESIRIAYK